MTRGRRAPRGPACRRTARHGIGGRVPRGASALTRHARTRIVLLSTALALSACGNKEEKAAGPGAKAPPPPVMGHGEQAFGIGGGATPYLDQGWSKQEPWGVWSEARAPTLKHALLDNACRTMRFKVQAHVTKTGGPMTVQVKIGETPVATWSFADAVAKEVALPCPALGTAVGPITFTPSYTVSPKQAGESADARPLGIALVSLKLDQGPLRTRRF